jgi:hypothetical protein
VKGLSRFITVLLVMGVLVFSIAPVMAQDPTPLPEGAQGGSGVRPTPPPIGAEGAPEAGTGFGLPRTLDELLAGFPDVAAYLDSVEGKSATDLDFAALYSNILTLYEAEGLAAVATFLKDSGLLEVLGVPVAYVDLLTFVDEENGLDLLIEEGRARGVISEDDELVGFLEIDDPANVASVETAMADLGVSTYEYNAFTAELEIGVPIDLLAEYQTASALLAFLTAVGTTEHVVGFRAPELLPPMTAQ